MTRQVTSPILNGMERLLIAVASGKGGVGKSLFSLFLSLLLAREKKVILIDLDLGSGNLHTYLGLPYSTPSISDFFKGGVPLRDLLTDTAMENLRFIGGGDSFLGIANPLYSTKSKLLRHVKGLEGEIIILDLSPGVHLNTLDFFNAADRGVVIVTPEAGSVLNAYSFIKGATCRRIERVFKRHPQIGPTLERHRRKGSIWKGIDELRKEVKRLDPETYPLIDEIARSLRIHVVLNMVRESTPFVPLENLIHLSRERLGAEVEKAGELPWIDGLTPSFSRIRRLVDDILPALEGIRDRILGEGKDERGFDDLGEERISHLSRIIDGLPDGLLQGESKRVMKLRLYFKPAKVMEDLIKRGVKEELLIGGV